MYPTEYILLTGIVFVNLVALISMYLLYKSKIEIQRLKEEFKERMHVVEDILNLVKAEQENLIHTVEKVLYGKTLAVEKTIDGEKIEEKQIISEKPNMPEKPEMPTAPKMPKMPETPKMPPMPEMPPMPKLFD